MKRIATLLAFVTLAVSARAAIFVATLQPSPPSQGKGGAFLTVNLQTRGWGLSGAISNLVSSASSVGIFGPTLPSQPAPAPWLPLVHDTDGEQNTILTGGGVFTQEELGWLQKGLFQIRVHTDRNQFPEGELHGPLVAVPEPGSVALVAGVGLCAYAGSRWSRRRAVLRARTLELAG